MTPLDHVARVGGVLDELAVPWALSGSLASSLLGEPRSTNDVDIALKLAPDGVPAFVNALSADYYGPTEAFVEASRSNGSFNLIHVVESFKVDLFFLGDFLLDRRLLERRQQVQVPGRDGAIWLSSAADLILRKLWWYRLGGEVSDRQWGDILTVFRVQAPRLDIDSLRTDAGAVGVGDLLDEVLLGPPS